MATTALTLALAGNPNCGKTTIFNNITGARQHVGNYPGVTVERREGVRQFEGKNLLVVDLPGTYSLTAYALDELVARNFIINERPDVIVDILDASNLERNLYLAVQILELERPVVFALNMADVAQKMGLQLNDKLLEQKLGVPVVRTIGSSNSGTHELLHASIAAVEQSKQKPFAIQYGAEIEEKIADLIAAFDDSAGTKYPLRWMAVKLLENDKDVIEMVSQMAKGQDIVALAAAARKELSDKLGEEIEVAIAGYRYQFVGELYSEIARSDSNQFQSTSDKIDYILTHRIIGLPIFLGIMWIVFNLVFTLGAYPQDWLDAGFKWLGDTLAASMPDGDLKSLLVDGIIGGVGSVLSFVPQIFILFFAIAILEDSGYIARAAFLMDRVMKAVGLHGKSFIPLILGFGCGVPAMMGARTLENPRDRMVTILITPFMSCSARLPVYTVLTAAFFSADVAGTVVFSLYLLGIVVAILMGMLFRKTLFAGDVEPFVMEMPPYHLPTIRSLLTHMWERGSLYLKKAGTIILAMSILMWFLVSYPSDVEYSRDYDQAKEAAQAAFETQVGDDILTPLGISTLEDNPELQATINQIGEIEKQFSDAKDADGEKAKDTTDNIAMSSKEEKLKAIEDAQPDIYPYAAHYWELKQDMDDTVDQLAKEQKGEKVAASYAGRLGHFLEPVVQPLGFDWKMATSLLAALTAKEIMVSTLGTIYAVGADDDDTSAVQDMLAADPAFTPLIAYALMVFVLLYPPCIAALSVMRRETGSWKWTGLSIVSSLTIAWVAAFIIYHGGKLLGY